LFELLFFLETFISKVISVLLQRQLEETNLKIMKTKNLDDQCKYLQTEIKTLELERYVSNCIKLQYKYISSGLSFLVLFNTVDISTIVALFFLRSIAIKRNTQIRWPMPRYWQSMKTALRKSTS
jgi:hypothetical protein